MRLFRLEFKLDKLSIFEQLYFQRFYHKKMSGRDRDPARTDRPGLERQDSNRIGGQSEAIRPATERELHYESPTKYDIDYYQRKVNRLQNEVSNLQQELSLHKFRLQKAEDFETKYQLLFAQHQNTSEELSSTKESLVLKARQSNDLRVRLDQAQLRIKNLQTELQNTKNTTEQIRKRSNEDQSKVSNQQAQKRASIQQQYLKQIDNIKSEARSKEDKLKKQLQEAQFLISSKENTESSLKFKLDRIKDEKNEEIHRLKESLINLKKQLSEANLKNDERLVKSRTSLIEETQSRINHLRSLASGIEATLLEEIGNLNEVISKKDAEIAFLIECDRKQIEENEAIQKDLKALIRRLEDKIFVIQRENQIQLFNTIDRLSQQYKQNLQEANRNFDRITEDYNYKFNDLEERNKKLQAELKVVINQAKNWEEQHKQIAMDKQYNVKLLSQKIIDLEKLKDDDLRNYTTSMRHIEDEAKNKLEDLHNAIMNKNTQFQILTAQINLKNEEISYLIDQINKLRTENREKMRKLQSTNISEQNSLNELISGFKKDILEYKRRHNELEGQITDQRNQNKMKSDLMRQQLNAAKEANEKLNSRNEFLTAWCKQLQNNLKTERISNVDILHDQTHSRRQTVQIREQVKVELQAIKERQVQQIRNVFRLQKGRLESDLIKRQQELSTLKAENNRLLVEYKNLQRKLGKPSKQDKGAQEQGKCKATLQAQIRLTQNIYNVLNRP